MERSATITLREKATEAPVLVTQGVVDRIGSSLSIRYHDGEAFYRVGVSEGLVSIAREGEEDYTLVLSEGKEHSFGVESPFGEIPLKVIPRLVRSKIKTDGLSVKLAYDLLSGEVTQKFRLYIDCKYNEDT
ncbi:MAG TPA: DUF1934 domain-containing protein [Candidatus Protoclostridium stercorigallinarum]|uniref:DUF1934 domain-containing protein n=1 Tax=Candidatus Protoclostridium stercorigallinarum TaxID=2838741 RepID=A0A9D1PXZ4_9FIRM|nr:DUF1934 domain-containing protein [Candidatus Protoclostridium stercorigallinarum]